MSESTPAMTEKRLAEIAEYQKVVRVGALDVMQERNASVLHEAIDDLLAEVRRRALAQEAVLHILYRIARDSRIAWFLGWGSESWALLTKAEAARRGVDAADLKDKLWKGVTTEAPRCSSCACFDCDPDGRNRG